MLQKRGDWMQSYDGRKVYPLDPDPEDFTLITVAHSLALKCRFNGHAQDYYSVGQHAVIVSLFVEPRHALWGLFHELDEVFLPDIPRPIKPFIDGWKEILHRNMVAGAKAFGLQMPIPDNVHYVDAQVLHTEKDVCMPNSPEAWNSLPPPLDYVITPVDWKTAEKMFLARYNEIIEKSDSPFDMLDVVP